MKSGSWKNRIRKCCQDAGTYKPFFEDIIDTLAKIMETRDECRKTYKDGGSQPLVVHINKAGAANVVKNPTLVLLMECDAQALAYWRDLGLTPAGYKKLNANVIEETSGALEQLLAKMA